MKLIKKIFFVFLTLAVIFVMSIPIYAYSLTGYKLPSKYSSIKFESMSSTYRSYWNLGIASWSTKGCSFIEQTSAIGTLSAKSISDSSILGIYYRDTVNIYGEITAYRAYLNTNASSSLSKTNWGRSTACHELGHPLGLNDLSSGNALMSHARNRSSIYSPQTDDLNGINAIY